MASFSSSGCTQTLEGDSVGSGQDKMSNVFAHAAICTHIRMHVNT